MSIEKSRDLDPPSEFVCKLGRRRKLFLVVLFAAPVVAILLMDLSSTQPWLAGHLARFADIDKGALGHGSLDLVSSAAIIGCFWALFALYARTMLTAFLQFTHQSIRLRGPDDGKLTEVALSQIRRASLIDNRVFLGLIRISRLDVYGENEELLLRISLSEWDRPDKILKWFGERSLL